VTTGERTLTPAAVARAIGVTPKTVREWIHGGRVEHIVTPTGRYRVPARVVDGLLEQKKTND
jgi:excisionase family DNA binding protein